MWRAQKESSLRGQVNYGYTNGQGYQLMPATSYVGGLGHAFDDFSRVPVFTTQIQPNVPADTRNVGPFSQTTRPFADGGYYYDAYADALEFAPDFVKAPVRGVGNVGGMLAGFAQCRSAPSLPLTGHRGVDVALTTVHQPNHNWPGQGMLTAVAPEIPAEGVKWW